MAIPASELGQQSGNPTESSSNGCSPDATINLFGGLGVLEISKGTGPTSGIEMRYGFRKVILIGNEGDTLRLLDRCGRVRVETQIEGIREKEHVPYDEIGQLLRGVGVVRQRTSDGKGEQLWKIDGNYRNPISLVEIAHPGKGRPSVRYHK